MSEAAVRIERSGPVWTVILSRPDRRNAVDGPTASALADAFRDFDRDPDAVVAVLHGEGGVFCSGADLKAIGTADGNRVRDVGSGDGPMGPTRLVLGKPVIAAIAGYAVAGGLELAIWCDLRVAEENAVLGVFCRRWGVPLIDGGTVRLPRLVGAGRAMDLVLTGREVRAAEALAIGLVDRVVPTGESRAAAEALAPGTRRAPADMHARGPAVADRGRGSRRARRARERARPRPPLARGRRSGHLQVRRWGRAPRRPVRSGRPRTRRAPST